MARLPGELVPQADVLSDIAKTVDAVAAGAETFQEIASAIGKGERQGRYYRKAAESMGLLENHHNTSALTPHGAAVAAASGDDRKRLLARAVLQNPVVRSVLVELASNNRGLSREEVARFLEETTTAGGTTPDRRMSTIWAWLTSASYASDQSGRLVATSMPGEAFVQVSDSLGLKTKPLTQLEAIKTRQAAGSGVITFSVEVVKRERANLAHAALIDDMATNVKRLKCTAYSNEFVDLATQYSGRTYIFEMKSATPGTFHPQVRRGVAQLYEYAYIQRVPESVPCLVIEVPPPEGKDWLVDYLVSDRKIQICWRSPTPTRHRLFDCPRACKPSIGDFL